MTTTTLPFTITVSRRGEPAFRRGFHTVKSARLYAKELAGNNAVRLIELSGPKEKVMLYERRVAR